METVQAVVAGVFCVDIIPGMENVPDGNLTHLLQPGRLLMVGPLTISTGGASANTGLALHRLGIPTRLIGKVGADPLGRVARDLLEAFGPGLADGVMVDPRTNTSYSLILSAPGFDRIFISCSGANDTFGAEDVDLDLVGRARLFHFGYPPVMRRMYTDGGNELVRLFQQVKQRGATTSLDTTFPDPATEGGQVNWREIFTRLLPFVDVFLPSFDELMFMLHRDEYDSARGDLREILTPRRLSALGAELLGMGVKIVVIKLGDQGLYLRTVGSTKLAHMGMGGPVDVESWSEREMWSACYRVEEVGTTGSGDATIAGFLSGLLRGLTPEEAVDVGVAVGACNVEAADALS
ncbi:MAG TPA: PfkB family carbohydrate kinase, partial [Anaerolinea sp.]|nr:PfkB family carbohydrate kinase [Anaerolinea sp.]